MIQFHNVTLRYPTGHEALRNVSFDIPQGAFYFITGHSGAGKSSILRLIYRAVVPTKGDVLVSDYNVKQLSYKQLPFLRRKIGIVFQDYKLLYDRSVYDNVALALEVCNYPSGKIRSRVKQVLEYVGLSEQMEQNPMTLSGGEQQRAAIARAIINQPDLIIADEPTGNLDRAMGRHIFALFDALHRQGSTILIVTHDLELMAETDHPHFTITDGCLGG
ncbi:MAG: cell division ATP-binding protein FtsE [Magnetococcales bacterium]|nr:cell division ATP-binding protein FtsE [Magnetococcales bacterium]